MIGLDRSSFPLFGSGEVRVPRLRVCRCEIHLSQKYLPPRHRRHINHAPSPVSLVELSHSLSSPRVDLDPFRFIVFASLFISTPLLCIYNNCHCALPPPALLDRVNISCFGNDTSLVYTFLRLHSTTSTFVSAHIYIHAYQRLTMMYEEMGSMTDDIQRRCSLP
jgi:hypothetical protein